MNKKTEMEKMTSLTTLGQEVGVKAARKIKAKRNAFRGVWFGLGMMGLIGWSVVIPTLLGVLVGIWLDSHNRGVHSWTLMLLLAGLCIGCLNAWHWVVKEEKEMQEEQDDDPK